MKRIIFLSFILLAPFVAAAQDKPSTQASDKPIEAKPAPAEAVIPAEAVKDLQAKAQAARLAQLEAENLALKIQQAQGELKKLSEQAEKLADESRAAYQRAAIKAGVPGDKIGDYDATQQPDGTLKLRRKAPAPPK